MQSLVTLMSTHSDRPFHDGCNCNRKESSIELVVLLEHVVVGLEDVSDLQLIVQLIVVAAAAMESASHMVNVLNGVLNALGEPLNDPLKESAVPKEVERD